MAHVAAQSWDWFFVSQILHDKEWLNQLRSVEGSFCAQITQMSRRAQAHQPLHHSDISSSHDVNSVARAVATWSCSFRHFLEPGRVIQKHKRPHSVLF